MPAIDTLLIDRGPGETRIAALSDGTVLEIYVHRDGIPRVDAIYRGRVVKALSGSGSCFVDIGLDKPAIMTCRSKMPGEGVPVDVRIVQAPRGGKGAKVAIAEVAEVSAALQSAGDDTSPPCLLRDADHPVATYTESYAATLKSVIIAPSDFGGRLAALVKELSDVAVEVVPDDIFSMYGVDAEFECALGREVTVPGGATVVIETTAALTTVDIDAGPMDAAAANLASIPIIARQLRLRSIGGPIIVDLIPAPGRDALVGAMREAVAEDPVRTHVSGLTPEGRLELNRRRIRPSLADLYLRAVTPAPSIESVAFDLLRRSVRQAMTAGSVRVSVRAHPRIVDALHGELRFALDEAEQALKTPLTLVPKADQALDQFDIYTE